MWTTLGFGNVGRQSRSTPIVVIDYLVMTTGKIEPSTRDMNNRQPLQDEVLNR